MSNVYHVLSTGNFSQDWSNAGLITTSDDWSGVPSIIGYRGDDITSAIAADPQTLTGEGTITVDVNANQTNPNTNNTGGVTEFAITDPVVALQGSGTADAPNLILFMDATGRQDVTFSFNARDIDGSADNTAQSIAVQYRIGTSGNFINIPAGYIADASTGPSLATATTAISVTLPSDANNQSQVQIRVITANANSNDEWIGIDDIVVSSSAIVADTTPPTLLSSSPSDGAAGVALAENITLTFNEPVQMVTGGGAIELRRTSDNSLVESFTQADVGTKITVAGATVTLNPTADLSGGTGYYVTVANNAIEDLAGNDFAGFSAPADLNFTTNATPTITVTLDAPASKAEGDSGTVEYTYTVTWANIAADTILNYSMSGGGANPASVNGPTPDLNTLGGSFGITAGNGSTSITITTLGDTIIETDEQFQFTLDPIAGVTITQPGLGTILNDDVALTAIYDIQGAGHRSPLVGGSIGSIANTGASVYNTQGVVTAIASNGFYLQDELGDGNVNTSDGIFVFTSAAPAATIAVGERVRVLNSRVDEFRSSAASASNDLTITQLNATVAGASIQELNTNGVVAPTIVGQAGRLPPTGSISDAGFATFDPAVDAADFWESLEGMLITIDNPIAISGTAEFSGNEEIWIVAEGAFDASSKNSNGGLSIGPGDQNPERIQIDDLITSLAFPNVTAGATFADITGVVNYSFTNYEVLITAAPVVLTPGILTAPETSTITALPRQITLANYNFENLDPGDGAARFSAFANQIVNTLNAPIIIAGQEIQDNDGATNSGTTSSSLTASTMIAAIAAAGGPAYAYVDIAPANNTSGGEQGGNIRPGFFYRSDIVEIVGAPLALDVAAFTGSRDPLVVTFRIIESRVTFTVINNHFSSKGGDNGLFGNVQPPVLSSEAGRIAQAQVVNDYVDSLLAINPNMNIVVAGDLNDFTYSPPVQTLIGGATPVLSELADALIPLPEDRYSYIFNGNSQELDHMLASANALSVATAFDIVHVNADFGRLQTSDHDPSLALFDARQLAEALKGTAGADSIFGYDGNDTISGNAGNDTLYGDGGNDYLYGGNNDDSLVGGSGIDVLLGEDGNDILEGGVGDGYFFGGIGTNRMTGGIDNDVFTSEGSSDTMVGGDGHNWFYRTAAGASSITGGTGIDELIGGAFNSNDTFNGGAGNDIAYGGDGNDSLVGGTNDDVLVGEAGNDTLEGGSGFDYLDGGAGNNSMSGGADDDLFYASGTSDTMDGGEGHNWYYRSAAGSASITGGSGIDEYVGGSFASNDIFNGFGGEDFAFGGDGDDRLNGGADNDALYGQNGDDTMDGGSGVNLIWADGTGSDQIRVDIADQGAQVIDFFEAGGANDLIRIVGSSLASFADFENLLTNYGTAVNGNMVVNTATSGILYLNLGATQNAIWFQGVSVYSLTAADFVFG
jgi:uncharacterized protein